MTTFYPTWEEANRNRSHGEEVRMGPDGKGRAMYYVDSDPLENKTESFTLEAPTTRYTVHVTLEADVPTVPKTFDTWREAEAHSQFVTMLLSGTAEPQPAYVTHDAVGSAYTTSGQHELYGEWSVTLTVRETH